MIYYLEQARRLNLKSYMNVNRSSHGRVLFWTLMIEYKRSEIDLTEHFHKNFFKKGPLYNQDWKFSLKPISIIKNIGFTDGLLKIEIENLTYPKPRHGYTLLDIESMKLIKK